MRSEAEQIFPAESTQSRVRWECAKVKGEKMLVWGQAELHTHAWRHLLSFPDKSNAGMGQEEPLLLSAEQYIDMYKTAMEGCN